MVPRARGKRMAGAGPTGSSGSRRSAARRRTEAARGFVASSAGSACSAPLVSNLRLGPVPGSSTGRSTGPVDVARAAKARLTRRSSSDWYAITTIRPPVPSASRAAGNAASSEASSWFTSMRRAWNVRLAGWPPAKRAGAGIAAGMAAGTAGGGRNGVADQFGQPRGRGDPDPLAFPDDGGNDATGELLLAVAAQYPDQIPRGISVDHLFRGDAGGRVHPHVQWRVLRVRETPVDLVELHGRYPEVEQHTVHSVQFKSTEHSGQFVVHRVHEVSSIGVRRKAFGAASQGPRVAVQPDQQQIRMGREHRLGMSTQAECRVHVHRSPAPLGRAT